MAISAIKLTNKFDVKVMPCIKCIHFLPLNVLIEYNIEQIEAQKKKYIGQYQ